MEWSKGVSVKRCYPGLKDDVLQFAFPGKGQKQDSRIVVVKMNDCQATARVERESCLPYRADIGCGLKPSHDTPSASA